MRLLMLRLVIGYPAWLALGYSIQVIPLGIAQTIQNLIPFIVLILSYLALKETLHKLEIINMFASFAGVLLIVVVSSRNKEALQLGDLGQSP